MGKRIKPGIDLAGHKVNSKRDLQLVQEQRLKRYKSMNEQFSKHTLEELKTIYNGKRSSTDRAALHDAIYLVAKKKYSETEMGLLKELFSKIPVNDGTFVYPEAKAIAEVYTKREKDESCNTANDNGEDVSKLEEAGVQSTSDSTNESTAGVELNH